MDGREQGKAEIRARTVGMFLDALASPTPTPGGGSAAAVAGAMAAALAAMVARLSKGKGGDDAAFERAAQAADRARGWLTALAAEDAEAFEAVLRALRLPRSTEAEKQARAAAVQHALRGAAEVPLRVMRQAVDVLRLLVELARVGNPNAASDAAAAALLAGAAAQGALHNVTINLASVRDAALAARLRGEAEALGREAERLRDAVLEAVRSR